MVEPREAGPVWGHWILHHVGMTMEKAAADEEAFFQAAITHLARPNKSKFRDVFPVGKRWQAKPYIRPGVHSVTWACTAPRRRPPCRCSSTYLYLSLDLYLCTGIVPPSPKKKRNKRGTGRQPRPKR